jgi:hypothetical protein
MIIFHSLIVPAISSTSGFAFPLNWKPSATYDDRLSHESILFGSHNMDVATIAVTGSDTSNMAIPVITLDGTVLVISGTFWFTATFRNVLLYIPNINSAECS